MNEPRLINVSNGQIIEINADKFSVGRSLKSSYVLDSVYISRTHFILEKNNGTWLLTDNSSNGTLHNGQIISYGRTKQLEHGDSIKLMNAETEFKFELYNEDPSITDEQLCAVVDSAICSKNEVSECDVLNDHCYIVQAPPEPPVINEVVISAGGEPSDSSIVVPLPGTSSGSDISSGNRKRSSSEKTSPIAKSKDESSLKRTKSNSPRRKSKSKEVEKAKDQTADIMSNFDMAEEEMQCSICSELFVKAVTLNCCHTFCKYCINQWRKQQNFCPICRNKITGMAPTLVLDNFIDKLVSKMDDETKSYRKEIVEYRLADEKAQVGSVPSTSKSLPQSSSSSSAVTISTTATSHTTVSISSDDDEDDEEGYSEDYSDDEDYYDNYYDYNGVPGKYYGGYGRCYNCNRTGHWANGCPFR